MGSNERAPIQPSEADRLECALRALAGLAHPDLRLGCRRIEAGDENHLTQSEADQFATAVIAVRRASGAARAVARKLLHEAGLSEPVSLPKLASGAPAWPTGFAGSLSHDESFAVAAIVLTRRVRSVGIDVEPVRPLPANLLGLVATPRERAALAGDLLAARLLFSMKEAVYKATYPLDGVVLEHSDIEVCLRTQVAVIRSGRRRLQLYTALQPRLLALTLVEHASVW